MSSVATTATSSSTSADAHAIARFQAVFRGRRSREMHVDRVKRGLPWSPFVPAKMDAVRKMLELAAPQPGETLLDIGSGDGRVLLTAAALQPRLKCALGVEIDAALVALSRRLAREQQLDAKVAVLHADWTAVEMARVDVAVLFFLPHRDIAATLQRKLRAGVRVVTYVFQIPEWRPERVAATVPFMTDRGESLVYLYRVPDLEAEEAGA